MFLMEDRESRVCFCTDLLVLARSNGDESRGEGEWVTET